MKIATAIITFVIYYDNWCFDFYYYILSIQEQ